MRTSIIPEVEWRSATVEAWHGERTRGRRTGRSRPTSSRRAATERQPEDRLRDNPLEGKKRADDDARPKALEAYILSSRKGVALDAGKH
jgi:hypothetical protein